MYEVGNNPDGGTAYKLIHTAVVPLAVKTGTAQVVGISQTAKKANERGRYGLLPSLARLDDELWAV